MLSECQQGTEHIKVFRTRILELAPLTCKLVLLNLIAGFSLDESIDHALTIQGIAKEED